MAEASLKNKLIRETVKCSKCGFCRAVCQVLEARMSESWGTRGRMILVSEFLRGGLAGAEESYFERIYSCLLCRRCEDFCPSHLDVGDIIEEARILYIKDVKPPKETETIKDNIRDLGNPLGFPPRRIYKGVNNAEEGETLFYKGCVGSIHVKDEVVAAENLLQAAEYPFFELPKEMCCGYILEILGRREEAIKLYRENYQGFKDRGVERIITLCPSCYKVFTERYPRYIPDFDIEVLYMVEIYNRLIDQGRLTPMAKIDLKIAYQDPCELGRREYHVQQARDLLDKIPGLRLKDEEEGGVKARCCGGGSASTLLFPKTHRMIRENRVKDFLDRGVHAVVTPCPTCIYTLRAASKGMTMAVDGLSRLLTITTGLKI